MRISDWSSDVCSSDLPVGLEEDLAKLGDAEVGKLARMAPALRKLGKVDQRLFDAFENIGRALARIVLRDIAAGVVERSEEHTSELQSLMRISYAVFCLKKKK